MYNIEEIKNKILLGDCLEELKKLPDESISCVITSPPYWGLRNYSVDGQIGLEKTFEEFLKKILEITAELKRVLKPTGQFWLNFGDCYGGNPAGNKTISPANQGYDGVFVRKAKQGQGAKSFVYSTDNERMFSGKSNTSRLKQTANQKCMLMMPERIALKMIDEQGWILRNKIKWAKQVLIKKENRTIGSVMPTSVKDRFNESGEELYFFVKNKKYYSDLDAVRLKLSPYTEKLYNYRKNGQWDYSSPKFDNQKNKSGGYWASGGDKFNYRVRDAKRKSGQSQFKASQEEIKDYPSKYGKGSEYEQKYGEPWDRFGKNTKKASNKVNDPRGNHEGGPGSWRDFKDNPENSYPKFQAKQSELRGKFDPRPKTGAGSLGYGKEVMDYYKDSDIKGNINGKNLPTVWLIGSELHNFQKEYGSNVDHFATFPEALCEIPIKFGCPKGGIVLDFFAGSGTALVVAKRLGRNYLGIELNGNYIEIAEKRIRSTPEPLL